MANNQETNVPTDQADRRAFVYRATNPPLYSAMYAKKDKVWVKVNSDKGRPGRVRGEVIDVSQDSNGTPKYKVKDSDGTVISDLEESELQSA